MLLMLMSYPSCVLVICVCWYCWKNLLAVESMYSSEYLGFLGLVSMSSVLMK